jgi:hypothetical protein
MKIREFLAQFEGRNPESEVGAVIMPFSTELQVIGVLNRGELETACAEPEAAPATLRDGAEPVASHLLANDVDIALPAGKHWDDTFILLDEED